MPSLLSRFKRSPSDLSTLSSDQGDLARSISSTSERRDSTPSSSLSSRGRRSSTVIEGLPNPRGVSPSPAKPKAVGTPQNHVPLGVPESTSKVVGTPKLVLTEEGSDSPRSFSGSPHLETSPRRGRTVGLGLQTSSLSSRSDSSDPEDTLTPRNLEPAMPLPTSKPLLSPDNISIHSAPMDRVRSGSVGGEPNGDKRPRRNSIINRVANKLNSPVLGPSDMLAPPGSGKSKKKDEKKRRKSVSSAKSGKSGKILPTGSQAAEDLLQANLATSVNRRRSPYLVRDAASDGDDASRLEIDLGTEDDDDDLSGSDFDDNLGVTGFAVASNRRNADFHALFPSVDEGDYLIDDYGCALSKDILVQGRFYISENHVCFHANIFGWVTDVVLPFSEIRLIEKKMTALVIPNAVGISTGKDKYTFASFISRDTTFDVLMNVWRLCNPNAVMSTTSFVPMANGSRAASDAGDEVVEETGPKGHARTSCACGKTGKHYSETALNATFPCTPDKIYNLMFTSEWFKTWLATQDLTSVEFSDWTPKAEGSSLLQRTLSYMKPLNGPVGPKVTRCQIADSQEYFDTDDYISIVTITKTPDVPSGTIFAVHTRTCLTWAGAHSTRVVVTSTVEWTGRTWIRAIVDKAAIDGQKKYHEDLASAMRQYMTEHPTEFARPEGATAGDDAEAEAEEEPLTEAEAYAAEARKQQRRDEDYTYLSMAFDMLVGAIQAIFSALRLIFRALSDLLSDQPINKELIMAAVIGLLLLSNIYTYFAFRDKAAASARRTKRLKIGEDEEMAEAVRMLLRDSSVEKRRDNARAESAELQRVLEQVEQRAAQLRGLVDSAVGGEALE